MAVHFYLAQVSLFLTDLSNICLVQVFLHKDFFFFEKSLLAKGVQSLSILNITFRNRECWTTQIFAFKLISKRDG